RWLKGRFLLLKILKRTKKRSRFLKKEILIVFIHLEASFFPDTLCFIFQATAFYFSSYSKSS
ncbi:IS5/IS1182 family transposase, partial [Lactobacillus crispatus]